MLAALPLGAETFQFRKPHPTPQGQYLEAVLTRAYGLLGHEVVFKPIAQDQELKAAASNQLAGALARTLLVQEAFPELVAVPFSLFQLELYLVGRRDECGYCTEGTIKRLGYNQGILIAERYAKSVIGAKKRSYQGIELLANAIINNQVDAGIMMGYAIPPSLKFDSRYIIKAISSVDDYHYLAPDKAYLKPALLHAFNTLKESGELNVLKKQFGIDSQIHLLDENLERIHWYMPKNMHFTEQKVTQFLTRLFPQSDIIADPSSFDSTDILFDVPFEAKSGRIYSNYHVAKSPRIDIIKNDLGSSKPYCSDIPSAQLPRAYKVFFATAEYCAQELKKSKVAGMISAQATFDRLTHLANLPRSTLVEATYRFASFPDNERGKAIKLHFDRALIQLHSHLE